MLTSWMELVTTVLKILLLKVISTKPPIRFENTWLEKRTLEIEWEAGEWICSHGQTIIPGRRNSKLLKGDIKVWNMEVFGRVEMKMQKLMNELEKLRGQKGRGDWRRVKK